MNISMIGRNTYTGRISSIDGQIKSLEKQKEQLHEQIKRINQSDTDEETKKEYIKVLKTQIEVIETQIQQKNAEKTEQAVKQSTEKQADSSKRETDASQSAYQNDLIQADFSLSRSNTILGAKTKLNGTGQVLSQEIALDQARGADTGGKQSSLQKVEVQKIKLDGEFGKELGKAKEKTEAPQSDFLTVSVPAKQEAKDEKEKEDGGQIDRGDKGSSSEKKSDSSRRGEWSVLC